MSDLMKFCDECNDYREVTVDTRHATYTFRDEQFEIAERYCRCLTCNSEVSDEEIDNTTLKHLSDLYARKSAEVCKEVRHSFGFTQQVFAKILNWGVASIKRYETGVSIPDLTHIGIYKQLRNQPSSIRNFYGQTKGRFSEEERRMIEGKFREMFDAGDLESTSFDLIKLTYAKHENTLETGNARFHLHKFFNMVLFFTQQGIAKTKLMKLLWYSDFLMFKNYHRPISGVPYWHLQYGPVPKNHDLVLGCLEGLELIEVNEEILPNGYIQSTVRSKFEFDETIFSEEELSALHKVQQFFKGFGAIGISDFAHQERGWRETSVHEIINYSYAKDLQLQ